MSYTAEVSRSSPTCVLLQIDQSSSMTRPFGGKGGQFELDLPPVEFPADVEGLPDDFAKPQFRTSSQLPQKLQDAAHSEGITAGAGSCGFVLNGGRATVVWFLIVGTRAAGE
jgi:hypothetical protein